MKQKGIEMSLFQLRGEREGGKELLSVEVGKLGLSGQGKRNELDSDTVNRGPSGRENRPPGHSEKGGKKKVPRLLANRS